MRPPVVLILLLGACTIRISSEGMTDTCAELADAICGHLEACSGQPLQACRGAVVCDEGDVPSISVCVAALNATRCDELDRGLPLECE